MAISLSHQHSLSTGRLTDMGNGTVDFSLESETIQSGALSVGEGCRLSLCKSIGNDAQRRGCIVNAGTTGVGLKLGGKLIHALELLYVDFCNVSSAEAGLNGNVARVGDFSEEE